MKVYKIQFEAIDNDCWERTENYGWKDYDSNLYACKELAKEALKTYLNVCIVLELKKWK